MDFCSLVALLETKAQQQFSSSIAHALAPKINWALNYDYHHLGRIWVGWDPSLLVSFNYLLFTQMISCSVSRVNSSENYLVSFVYGLNTYTKRTKKRLLVWNFSCSCFNNSGLYTHPLDPSCHFNFILILRKCGEADLIGTLGFHNSMIVFSNWWNSTMEDPVYIGSQTWYWLMTHGLIVSLIIWKIFSLMTFLTTALLPFTLQLLGINWKGHCFFYHLLELPAFYMRWTLHGIHISRVTHGLSSSLTARDCPLSSGDFAFNLNTGP